MARWGTAGFDQGPVQIQLDATSDKTVEVVRLVAPPPFGGTGSVLQWGRGEAWISSDHIGSVPLFFSLDGPRLTVSDSIDALISRKTRVREGAREEYLASGLCGFDRTLAEGIRRVPASSTVHISHSPRDENPRVAYELERYPRHFFDHTTGTYTFEEAFELSTQVFSELLDAAGDRQLVVPLSAGLDSRLVLMILHTLGARNILTYTYGYEGAGHDSVPARVASSLGVPWLHVPYSRDTWIEQLHNERIVELASAEAAAGSVAHLETLAAPLQLRDEGIIQSDAVIVLGHSGDFIAGSHLNDKALGIQTRADLARWIFNDHYQMNPYIYADPGQAAMIVGGIEADLQRWSVPEVADSRDAEAWDARERQSRLILSSARMLLGVGLAPALPLWHPLLVEYWTGLENISYRVDRSANRRFVDEVQRQVGVSDLPAAESGVGRFLTHIHLRANGTRGWQFVRRNPITRRLMWRTIASSRRTGYVGMQDAFGSRLRFTPNLHGFAAQGTLELGERRILDSDGS